MMYNDVIAGDIPILSFLKGTDYALYVGPELSPDQRERLRNLDLTITVIYLPEILEELTDAVVKYNFPGVTIPESLTVENLQDYRDELSMIYGHVCTSDDSLTEVWWIGNVNYKSS